MKILLLSDIPPCENLTAGLVLSAMVRFIPKNEICFYIVSNPSVEIKLNPEFANIPMKIETKPNENWSFLPQRRVFKKASSLVSYVSEIILEKTVIERKIEDAIAFGKEQKVDRVWAVLQGQTTIRMAKAVADGLGVPLHSHVWDPFSWWASAHCLDGKTTRKVQAKFDEAIATSQYVGTASEPMAELFKNEFGAKAVPVIASHSETLSKQPLPSIDNNDSLIIGMAGQFYASAEWECLLKALTLSNWQVSGRSVKLIVLGPQKPPGDYCSSNVKYLGWKSQVDASLILSHCDVLYCPYPFDVKLEEVSKYSFPSKLVLYLAAGKPIIFHGPSYSSPNRYIEENQCGVCASSLLPSAIYNEIEKLVNDKSLYNKATNNAQHSFLKDFTLESLRKNVSTFLSCDTIIDESEYNQHFLSQDTEEFKLLENKIENRKLSNLHKAHDAYKNMHLKLISIRKIIKNRILSKLPPFKRYYIEIEYYEKEVKRLRKLYANVSDASSDKKLVILNDEVLNENLQLSKYKDESAIIFNFGESSKGLEFDELLRKIHINDISDVLVCQIDYDEEQDVFDLLRKFNINVSIIPGTQNVNFIFNNEQADQLTE